MQTEIKEQPPYDVVTIGNVIIRYGMQEGRRLTNVELQKLLYMTQLIHVGLTGNPLFQNKMEAWDSVRPFRMRMLHTENLEKNTLHR